MINVSSLYVQEVLILHIHYSVCLQVAIVENCFHHISSSAIFMRLTASGLIVGECNGGTLFCNVSHVMNTFNLS